LKDLENVMEGDLEKGHFDGVGHLLLKKLLADFTTSAYLEKGFSTTFADYQKIS